MASTPDRAKKSDSDTEQLPQPPMKPDSLEPRILLSGTWAGAAAEPVDGATDDADTFQGDSGRDIAHGLDGDDMLFGNGGNDRLFGDDGDDDLFGGAGRDRFEADAPTLVVADTVTTEDTAVPLELSAGLTDTDGSEALVITLRGVPRGASLSAGIDNGDGSWNLSADDLDGLMFAPPADFSGPIDLTVEVATTDTANRHETSIREGLRIDVTPAAEGGEDDDIWTDEDLARLVEEVSEQALGSGPRSTREPLLLVDQLDVLDAHLPIHQMETSSAMAKTFELAPLQHDSAELANNVGLSGQPYGDQMPDVSNADNGVDRAVTSDDAAWPGLSLLWGALRALTGTRRGPNDGTFS